MAIASIKLLDIDNLTADDIFQIWQEVNEGKSRKQTGNVAWSFEGNGIRTRTTFIQAFQNLGLHYVELPNFLKSDESVQDLAGYMDAFYSMYIIRENDHSRLTDFACATQRPVINAMSNEAHPCEVLTDAYYLKSKYGSLKHLRILLWGPVTNVFKSWHSLAGVLGLNMTQYCAKDYQPEGNKNIAFTDRLDSRFDVVITDAWPVGFSDKAYSLSMDALIQLGKPELLPTPPVSIGKEFGFMPTSYDQFTGYAQKQLLLPVQEAIVSHLLGRI